MEAISKSRYWKESAIFVTEDDAQNGLDHVDGHRTVGTGHQSLDAARRSGQHLLHDDQHVPHDRTDSGAAAIQSVRSRRRADVPRFFGNPDFRPYKALQNKIPLDEMNPPLRGLGGLNGPWRRHRCRWTFRSPTLFRKKC